MADLITYAPPGSTIYAVRVRVAGQWIDAGFYAKRESAERARDARNASPYAPRAIVATIILK